jgi:hypothetical protein
VVGVIKLISIIQTGYFTFLTILALQPSPTIMECQKYDNGEECSMKFEMKKAMFMA